MGRGQRRGPCWGPRYNTTAGVYQGMPFNCHFIYQALCGDWGRQKQWRSDFSLAYVLAHTHTHTLHLSSEGGRDTSKRLLGKDLLWFILLEGSHGSQGYSTIKGSNHFSVQSLHLFKGTFRINKTMTTSCSSSASPQHQHM